MNKLKVIFAVLDKVYEIVISMKITANSNVFDIEDIKCEIINQILYNELKVNNTDENSVNINLLKKLLYNNIHIKYIINNYKN